MTLYPPETAAILLVDDVPANLLALEAILTPLGQRLVKATSGREALRALLHEDFACILLDVQMPGLDGFETAKLIKARPRSQYTPILFITAFSTSETNIDRGYAEGAVDYIVKPFNPDILRTKVAVFVDLFLQAQRLLSHRDLLRDRDREVMEREARERFEAAMAGVPRREPAATSRLPFEVLLGSAPFPVAVVGPDERFLFLNDAFLTVLDQPGGAAIGKTLTDAGAGALRPGVRQAFATRAALDGVTTQGTDGSEASAAARELPPLRDPPWRGVRGRDLRHPRRAPGSPRCRTPQSRRNIRGCTEVAVPNGPQGCARGDD